MTRVRRLWLIRSQLIRGVSLIVLAGWALSAMSSAESAKRVWSGPPIVTKDGKTHIMFAGITHRPKHIADIGFFDPDGKERAVIAGRHGILQTSISYDGYLLIRGTVVGREGHYVSLYSPYGHLQWEIPVQEGDPLNPLAVAVGGRRAAVATRDQKEGGGKGKYLALLNEAGSVLKRHPVDNPQRNWYAFAAFCGPDDRFLLATTVTSVLMFNAEDLSLSWRAETHIGRVVYEGLAMSDDSSQLALLSAVSTKGQVGPSLQVTLLDVKTGEVLHQAVPPVQETRLKLSGLSYDPKQKAFLIETRDGTYTVGTGDGANATPKQP